MVCHPWMVIQTDPRSTKIDFLVENTWSVSRVRLRHVEAIGILSTGNYCASTNFSICQRQIVIRNPFLVAADWRLYKTNITTCKEGGLLLVILCASQVVHSGNWRSKSDFQSYWHCQPPRFEWSRAVRRLRRKEEGMHDEHVNLCKFFRYSVHDIHVEIYMVHQYLSLYCIYSASCQGRTRSPGHLHVYPGSFQPKTIYHFWLHLSWWIWGFGLNSISCGVYPLRKQRVNMEGKGHYRNHRMFMENTCPFVVEHQCDTLNRHRAS